MTWRRGFGRTDVVSDDGDELGPIHLVIAGDFIIQAYTPDRADQAHIHARCVTGAFVMSVSLRDRIPSSIREDINSDFDDGGDTPVVDTSPTLDQRPKRR